MNNEHYRFEGFELDWPGRRLLRDGREVSIEPKSLEVIHYLISHRQRAVSRDELAEAVWVDRVISDSVISQTMRKARRALGDDGDRQDLIATVRGYGYRFVAEVEAGAVPEPSAPSTDRTAPAGSSAAAMDMAGKPPKARWAIAAGLLVAVLIAMLYFATPARAPDSERIAVMPRFELSGAVPADQAWLAEALPELLALALARSDALLVYPPALVKAQLGDESDGDGSAREVIGARLGAQVLIDGHLSRSEGRWRLVLEAHRLAGPGRRLTLVDEEPVALVLRGARHLAGNGQRAALSGQALEADDWLAETLARGLLALSSGEPARAHDYFSLARDSAPGMAWATYQLAVTSHQLGDLAASDQLLEELDDLLDQAEPRLARLASNQRALNHWRRGQLDEAGVQLQRKLALADQVGHGLDQGNAHLNLAIVRSNLGDTDTAEAHFLSALGHYNRIGYQPGRALVANSLGAQAWRQGRRDQAETWHQQALELRRELGNPQHVAQSLVNLAAIEASRLDPVAAERHLEEARLIYRALAMPQMEAYVLSSLAANHIDTGRYSSARGLLEQALALSEQTESVQQAAEAEARLGVLDQLEGELESALARLEQATDRYREIGVGAALVETLLVLAEYRALAGQLDQAEAE
ncbi:MAG: hypothetical protein EA370_02555, partial [Wenzhouxiangella sp.]